MKETRSFLMSLLLMIVLVSCNLPLGQLRQEQITTSSTPVKPTALPLILDMLKNAEYQAQNGMTLVNLVDGRYETGSGADYLSVSMLDQVAFGDLNSDGTLDAAIILAENYGGTGQYEYLVPVFNSDGHPSPSSGYFLGDRVVVKSIGITNSLINLDILVHAPNDALCCPSQVMTQSFRFYWGPGLVQVHATSGTSAGGLRKIVIESPTNNREVSNQVLITGWVSISPFENTLVVRIMDSNNIPAYQGPIQVNSPGMGAPGTFDTMVDLSSSSINPGMIRIEIIDISMADGSILSMDSVDVILK